MKVLIATGASAGHIFPALSVAQCLKKDGHRILIVTTAGFLKEKIKEEGWEVVSISSKGFSSSQMFLHSVIFMGKAILESFGILKSFKPDTIAGFGGYGAFPVVCAGWLLRYPTLIHEQNVVPGRANRILSRMADKIALSFQRTKNFLDSKKTIVTGCPLRLHPQKVLEEELLKKFHLKTDLTTIFVLGGSQGSRRINEEFIAASSLLKDHLQFQVIHLTGMRDFEGVKGEYQKLGIPFYAADFLDNIQEAYAVADVVVARAGAVTVFEIAAFCVPAILIPYPLAGGHQRENASILSERGVAVIIEESQLNPHTLKEAILKMLEKKFSKDTLAKKTSDIHFPDADRRLAAEILKLKR